MPVCGQPVISAGDFYDFFELDDGRLGFVIADVSGKGMAAALFMAVASTVIRTTAMIVPNPGACLEKANEFLSADNPSCMFVTTFLWCSGPKQRSRGFCQRRAQSTLPLERRGQRRTVRVDWQHGLSTDGRTPIHRKRSHTKTGRTFCSCTPTASLKLSALKTKNTGMLASKTPSKRQHQKQRMSLSLRS